LIRQVRWAVSHPAQLAIMRQAARAEFEARYTADQNYESLMQIYHLALNKGSERLGEFREL
jgi:hypothetical protein